MVDRIDLGSVVDLENNSSEDARGSDSGRSGDGQINPFDGISIGGGGSDTVADTTSGSDADEIDGGGSREGGTVEIYALAPVLDDGETTIAAIGSDAAVNVAAGGSVSLVLDGKTYSTDDGFVGAADQFVTHVTWASDGSGTVSFQNLETGTVSSSPLENVSSLTGTREIKTLDQDGDNQGTGVISSEVTQVTSVFEPKEVDKNPANDGVVDGSRGNDEIDSDYVDAEGDKVSNGADVIQGYSGNDTITGLGGNDEIYGGIGNDQITGGDGSDAISGGDGDDWIFVDSGDGLSDAEADKVDAGAGNDFVFAGAGDYASGGEGEDTLVVNDGDQVEGVKWDEDGQSGVVVYNNGQTLTFQNFQTVQGLSDNPVLDGVVNGTDDADVIDQNYTGDPHGDSVDAGDAILPGDTNDMDVIEAYGGNDSITAGNEDDEVYAGSGADWVQGNGNDDWIAGEDGADTLYGDNGNAILVESAGAADVDSAFGISASQSASGPATQAGSGNGNTYCIGEDGELCLDFDTEKTMVTEDVWFAEKGVVVTTGGEIIGDCSIEETETNTFSVKLDAPVTQDTLLTVTITDGTANQAGDPDEFTYGSLGYNTQYWWQNQAHADWAPNQSWAPGFENGYMSQGPDAQGDIDTDFSVGTAGLVNDFRVFDASGAEVTGQTFTVLVPAGSDTSATFSVEALHETSVNGMNSTFGGLTAEGDETFTMQVTEIGGQAVSAPVKDIDILDDANNVYSPIAFDLNGNGQIDVTGTSTAYGHAFSAGAATVSFDIDADGTNEDIEWMAGNGDGLLIDTSLIGPGNAVDGGALFGDEGGTYANGYVKLDLRDLNGDDMVSGSELQDLAIWVDDGDAVLEAGELETLAENGISEIASVATPTVVNGETLLRSETNFDAEVTGDVQYSLTGPDADLFEIDPDTGKLTYADGFDPDYDNPADADGDNVYEFDVVRTCTTTGDVENEPVEIKIEDPCVGGNDTIMGGADDDVIFGQGGDDSITGGSGDDEVYGGCGNDTIIGDNDDDGVDLDPSDGCITLVDDQPCFCLDLGTTKTMVTEDVWFAEKVVITDTNGEFVGECDLVEGENSTFTIELDAPVTVDTIVQIQIGGGTAGQATGNFNEFIWTGGYQTQGGSQPTTDEVQWWVQDQAHADYNEAQSWYNAGVFFGTPNYPGTTGTMDDAYQGVGELVNDFEVLDQNGNLIQSNLVSVLVPAGSTTSEAFTIETNVEAMIHGGWQNAYQNNVEGDEAFDMQIVSIGGQAVNGTTKEVMIEDNHLNVYSPISFDLNWDGEINVTGQSTAYGHTFDQNADTVEFDIDGDGLLECIEWMEANEDGLLINMAQVVADGGVATGKALYGDEGGTYANGYEKLDLLDTIGGDDVLVGSELDDLAIWIDDGDGILEAGETVSLASQGITELSTVGQTVTVGGEELIRSETEADMEATGMVQYSITGPDASFFEIDPDTGKLTYADGFIPDASNPQDANGDGEYEINIIRTPTSGNGSGFNEPLIEPLTIKIEEDAVGGDDLLFGGDGDDVIDGEGGNDTIQGDSGDDTIDGGFGDDSIRGDNLDIDDDNAGTGSYNDNITGGWGSDTIKGELGDDTIYAGGECGDKDELCDSTDPDPNNDRDIVFGDSGDDLIYGGDDADTLLGHSGEDTLYGGMDNDLLFDGAGNDIVYGGHGDDTMRGGSGEDEMYGGDDRDVFTHLTSGDCVFGGTGSKAPGDVDDFDTLDLSTLPYGYTILSQTNDADGNSTSGVIGILDANGDVVGKIKFEEIEKIVCFTAGTQITTDQGERNVEDLVPGDKVLTRDNGFQEIVWAGSKAISAEMLKAAPALKPVMIEKGALGADLPSQDLMVSPNHRVVVENPAVELMFEESEVLAAAKHLVGKPGIYEVDIPGTDYVHIMCERHEVVLSNGAWTESFQPGDEALAGVDADQREELFSIFPELRTEAGRESYSSARMILKAHEAKLAL